MQAKKRPRIDARVQNHHSQTREIRLRILIHNLIIVKRMTYVLYRAKVSLLLLVEM